MFFGNNNCIWIILILILVFCCNGNRGNGGCGNDRFYECDRCCD